MTPRIAPGRKAELGRVNHAITSVLGLGVGGSPPNVMTTLGRHRGLFRRWLWFSAALMPGGRLPRRDTELAILRVAHVTGCDYEWHHHERIGRAAGLSEAEIARVRDGAGAAGWTPREQAILRATDELIATHDLGDETWAALAAELDSDVLLLELLLLVGNYTGLAGALNAARVQVDGPPKGSPSPAGRLVQAAARRRGAA